MIVLDASALLAYLFAEPGHERVGPELPEALLSAVNLAEVLSRFARDGHDPAEAAERIRQAGVTVVPYTQETAIRAAALVRATLPLGLSLGDRACLALAAEQGLQALTADRTWTQLSVGVEVQTIR